MIPILGTNTGDRRDRGLTEEMERSAARKTAVAPWIWISSRFLARLKLRMLGNAIEPAFGQVHQAGRPAAVALAGAGTVSKK